MWVFKKKKKKVVSTGQKFYCIYIRENLMMKHVKTA